MGEGKVEVFGNGCKLFITQALKIVCLCFVGIQKRYLNNLSSPPVVPANLLPFPKAAVWDWSVEQLLSSSATRNTELLSVLALWHSQHYLFIYTVADMARAFSSRNPVWPFELAKGLCINTLTGFCVKGSSSSVSKGQHIFSLVDFSEVRRNTTVKKNPTSPSP